MRKSAGNLPLVWCIFIPNYCFMWFLLSLTILFSRSLSNLLLCVSLSNVLLQSKEIKFTTLPLCSKSVSFYLRRSIWHALFVPNFLRFLVLNIMETAGWFFWGFVCLCVGFFFFPPAQQYEKGWVVLVFFLFWVRRIWEAQENKCMD